MNHAIVFLLVSMVLCTGCTRGAKHERTADVRRLREFIQDNERFHHLVLEPLEYPSGFDKSPYPQYDYVLMGEVASQVDFRVLFEAVYRLGLQSNVSMEVQIITTNGTQPAPRPVPSKAPADGGL